MKGGNIKGATYCMISTIVHSGKGQNYRNSKKISGCHGLERRKRRAHRAQRMRGSETIQCDITM